MTRGTRLADMLVPFRTELAFEVRDLRCLSVLTALWFLGYRLAAVARPGAAKVLRASARTSSAS